MTAPDDHEFSVVKELLWATRLAHESARLFLAQSKPDHRTAEKWMKIARKSGRRAASFLPLGELRQRLESGELMSEVEWERFCGPLPPPPEMRLLQP
jgi:hypothetical protein